MGQGITRSNLWARFFRYITSRSARKKLYSAAGEMKPDIGQEDCRIFEALCQFLWIQGDPLPLIFDIENEIYTKQGITLARLKQLEAKGLIHFESAGFVKKGYGQHTRLFYCGRPTKIGFRKAENNCLDLGHVLLTERGKEFASGIKVSRNQQFYEYVIERWFHQGLVLSSIQIDRNRKADCGDSAYPVKARESRGNHSH